MSVPEDTLKDSHWVLGGPPASSQALSGTRGCRSGPGPNPAGALGCSSLSPSGLGLLLSPTGAQRCCWRPGSGHGCLGPQLLQVRPTLLPDRLLLPSSRGTEFTPRPQAPRASGASAPKGAPAPDPGPLCSRQSGWKRGCSCWDPWIFCVKVLGSVFQTFLGGAQPGAASKRRPGGGNGLTLIANGQGPGARRTSGPAHPWQRGAVPAGGGPYLGPLDQANCVLRGPQRKHVTPQQKRV